VAKLSLLLIGSLIIIYVSRGSLRDVRSHGFYRFLAWECMLALFALNVECWFCDPSAWHQVISWILLIASIVPVVLGMQMLRKQGRQDSTRDDAPMLAFEKTTALVTVGIYKYIRHPLYSSLLFLTWGIFFKLPSLLGLALALAAAIFLTTTAKVEEVENVRFFGSAYTAYMAKTRMFVPFLF
jgi:protein-S-isoprenylcysteine O-methyltransferase Ste14